MEKSDANAQKMKRKTTKKNKTKIAIVHGIMSGDDERKAQGSSAHRDSQEKRKNEWRVPCDYPKRRQLFTCTTCNTFGILYSKHK